MALSARMADRVPPGTAYILMHHCMGGVAGKRGLWGFVKGGMGAVSEAIAASARSKGAEIRMNAPVSRVLIRNGRAYGVVLENGDELHASIVASNLDPKATFLKLVEPGASEPRIPHFDRALPRRRHVAQDESRARWPAGFHSSPRNARPATRRDHAHLPLDRLRRARLG